MRYVILKDDFDTYLCMEEGRTVPRGFSLSGDGRWWATKAEAQEWVWCDTEAWEMLG